MDLNPWIVYITIGAIDGNKPMLDHIPAEIHDELGETEVTVARAMLKDHANAVHIPWKRLYYRVYRKDDDTNPIAESTNAPKR